MTFCPPQKGPPLRQLVRAALWPASTYARGLLVLVACRPLIIWAASRLLRVEPLGVTALYRPGGDVQYYELVAALARGTLGESNLWETYGEGLHPFPLAGIALHALGFALAGAYGLLLADTLVAYAFFVLYSLLARLLGARENTASTLAGFAASYLFAAAWPITDSLGFWRDLYWGDRFPRPYVTSVFVYLALSVLAVLWTRPREPRSITFFSVAGVSAALLVQSDIYSAFIVSLATLPVLLNLWRTRSSGSLGPLSLRLAFFLSSFALVVWPFVLQKHSTTAALLVRWGAYPVSRLHALTWIREVPPAGFLVLAGFAALTWLALRRSLPERRALALSHAAFWLTLVVGASVSLPLFSAVLGQGLYPYMFPDRIRRFALDGALFLFAIAIVPAALARFREVTHNNKSGESSGRFWPRMLGAGFTLAVALSIVGRGVQNARRETHTRVSWYNFESLGSYRHNFSELAYELKNARYSNLAVLGTLDQQVHVYWQAFHGGYAFVPDAWVSIANEAELEHRFASFAHLLGATEAQYAGLLGTSGLQIVFMSVSKYAANREHTYAPLSDYTPEQRARIARRGLFVAFQPELPESELRRLTAKYRARAQHPETRRLDLVVLTNDAPFRDLAPPADRFQRTFENEIFRVYVRNERQLRTNTN
ncbi:MAG: hypothetical protein SFV15_17355 [Polyangiaceae bacterium]|nr:hypothetical protein [Polyangiaceae bacterium]